MDKYINSKNRKLIAISYYGMFSAGMVISFLGPLLSPISNTFNLKLEQMAFPVVFNFSGFLLATLTVAFFWHTSRVRLLLYFSSLLLSLSLISIALFHNAFITVLVLIFFVGFFAGLLHTGLDSFLSEFFGSLRAKNLNILHIFVSLGCLASPLLIGIILTYSKKWQIVPMLMGSFNFPLTIFFGNKKLYNKDFFVNPPKVSNIFRMDQQIRINWKIFLLINLVIFLYLGIESSLVSWTPLFLVKIRNINVAPSSYYISFFWLAMIFGRLIFSKYFFQINLTLSLIMGAVGGSLFVVLTFLVTESYLLILFIICTGLVLSHVYPNILALGGNIFPSSIGFVTGFLTSSGFVGSIFFPWFIGRISQAISLQKSMLLISFLGILQAILLIYFYKYSVKS